MTINFFKRPSTHYGKAPQPETPYQRAAQVWDDRIGSAEPSAEAVAFWLDFLRELRVRHRRHGR